MYSQSEEEKYILEAFPEDKTNGRFLDIGAWNAKQLSNTRALFELGWSGVMIEPSPGPMLQLLGEYGNEPRIQLVQAAVGLEQMLVQFHITDDAVSTVLDAEYEKWKDATKFHGSLEVPTLTPEYIARRWGGFDFINIDAEGQSVDLFLEMLRMGWQPRCFCVEIDRRMDEMSAAATRFYNLTYANGCNAVWVRK